jgi:hypothetical protein
LGGRQSERSNIRYHHEHCGEVLSALDDPKLGGLFDRVNGIGTTVSKTDHLGLRRLGLQQERREVGGTERVSNSTNDLAAIGLDCCRRIAFCRTSKGIIHSHKKPSIPAGLHRGFAGAISVRPCVVQPVNRVGVTFGPGEVRGRRGYR